MTPTQQLIVGRGELEVRVDGPVAAAEDRSPLVFLHEGLGSVDLWRTFPDDVRHDVGVADDDGLLPTRPRVEFGGR